MRAGRWLMIAALFFIDVRVRAENDKPQENCWGKSLPCAVEAFAHKRELKAGDDFTMVMAAGSLAQQRDAKTVQLVDGRFYIEVADPIVFKTPYAQFSCAGACKAIVERRPAEVNVKALEGEWKLKRTGEKREYALMGGLQISISEVETGGMAHMDFPQSLPWAPTVLEWSRLYPGPVELFKSEVTRFRSEWKTAVESASKVFEQTAARAVASYEEGLAKERARRKAEEKEEAALRELFRKKNDIDP